MADDLKLHWFYVWALQLHRTPPWPVAPDRAQVVNQLLGRGIRERDTDPHGWLLHGPQGGVAVEEVQAERDFQVGRNPARVAIQAADVLLPHREQRPSIMFPVSQGGTDLTEEGVLAVPVGWIDGQDLFELVEDEHLVAVVLARELIQVLGQP